MTRLSCLFCGRLIGPGEPRCPAFERAGVAAHQRCCGCQGWVGWTRPGQALPPVAEGACR
jgi:hypothetical protein